MDLKKDKSSKIFLTIILAGFVISVAVTIYFINGSKSLSIGNRLLMQKQLITSTASTTVAYSLPSRLIISKINVDAPVEYVGLTSNGEMGVPKGPVDVAWFRHGPRPGERGSAVVSGHFGPWKDGRGSVFDDLNKLEKGDKVSIQDDKGTITTFTVREIRLYDPNAEASYVFESKDGQSHLNLVTCEGVWNGADQSYSKRLVVFTDKEN